jgi:D-amino peptidase
MKVFISCDIEGIGGVIERDQTDFKGKDYDKAREWMTNEVNAVIEAALACKATKILVNDAHGDMFNILIDKLNPKATIISGSHKPLVMMEGIQSGFDAVAFVGYHARVGTIGGVLDHTMHGRVVHEFRINNRLFGETGINALIAGHYKTPVVLVCGDEATSRESKAFLGKVETVVVKRGITRYAAESVHPTEAVKRIKEAALRAFKDYKSYKPFIMKGPLNLALEFMDSGMADEACLMPGTKRLNGFRVAYKARDIVELCQASMVLISLAYQTIPRK